MDELPAGYDLWLESPYTGPEADVDEDEPTACGNPGRDGCGYCDACEAWGDDAYHASREDY
jgi:hypothetical protein